MQSLGYALVIRPSVVVMLLGKDPPNCAGIRYTRLKHDFFKAGLLHEFSSYSEVFHHPRWRLEIEQFDQRLEVHIPAGASTKIRERISSPKDGILGSGSRYCGIF